ncbi:MAG: hypothetical protein C4290_03625 [Chloroflexota bacterium]
MGVLWPRREPHPSSRSTFAEDRLMRLREALCRQQAVEECLHGPALALARALAPRVIFALYLDCRQAGVGEEAQRLIAAARHRSYRDADLPEPPATRLRQER